MFEAKLAAEFVNHHEFQSTYLDKISVDFFGHYISLKLYCIDIITNLKREWMYFELNSLATFD